MAKLLEIVNRINADIISNQLSSKKFQKGRFNAIAELIPFMDEDVKQTVPVITDNDGESVKLTIDDSYPIELYHRHLATTLKESEEDDYGDRMLRIEESKMKMVVIGDRSRLDLTKEELITGILSGISLEMPQSFLTTNSLQGVVVTPGTFDTDFEKVYREEYNLEKVELTPSSIFIALDYTIETSVYTACVSVCE